MKKKMKYLGILAVVVAAILMFAGCSQSGSGSSSGSSDGQTNLTFAIWDKGQKDGMEAIAKAYMEKHPNVKIEVQVTDWSEYWTKLEANVNSNTLPDIFWMHTNEILEYADAGILADVSDIVDTSHFSDASLSNAKGSDGKLYGVPKDKDSIGLVYNKELFDQAGVAYPNESWTWDDIVSASQKIYDKTGKYGYMAYADEQLGYWNFVYQAGGYILSPDKTKGGFDQPATKKAMAFYTGLQKYDWCPDQNYFAENSPGDSFFSGKGAMYLEGSWNMLAECENYPEMNGKWDVAVLPKCPDPVSGDGRATVTNGLTYATAAKGKNREAAMDFLKFLGSEEGQRIQGESGAAIPAYKGLEDTWVNVFKNKGYQLDAQKFIDMLAYGVPGPNSISRPAWKTEVNAELLQIYSGAQTLDQGLAHMQTLINQASAEK